MTKLIHLIKSAFLVGVLLGCLPTQIFSQEFFCTVSVNANRITGDKQVFQDMRRAITEYINDYQWTSDRFDHFERIRWQLRINVINRPSADYFKCSANIIVFRPVYGSTEETVTISLTDQSFDFNYVPQQPMQHVDNTYQDNLTALLNFYSYLVLSIDYDTFGENAGEEYLEKAQEMLNLANNSNESGWRSNESNQNRYWLVENLTNTRYKVYHEAVYKYYREGMDQMVTDVNKGRTAVMEALRDISELRSQNNLLYLLQIFAQTKKPELINIFKGALPNQKQEFLTIMEELDPASIGEYNAVNEESR